MSGGTRENIASVRWLLLPFVVLAGLGAIQLYVFPAHTDRFFAWTLQPTLSAMFMGAGYGAGVLLTVMSYRRQPWAVTRTATITIFIFVVLMAAATFMHLDKMHLDGATAPLSAQAAAWLWITVYIVVPPAMLGLIVVQQRQPGEDPSRDAPLPSVMRSTLGYGGGLMAALGVVMFIWPTAVGDIWPWEVTALSGRAIAAWIVAIGWAGIEAAFENDLPRVRPAAATFAVLGVLWFAAVIRGASEMLWERPTAVIYVAFTLGAVGLGSWGVLLSAPGRTAFPPPSEVVPGGD